MLIQIIHLLGYPNSVIPFHSKTVLVWQFNVTGNNKTYSGLHATCLILTNFGFPGQIFITVPIKNCVEIHPVGVTLIHADGQTDKMKRTGDFCDYANASTKVGY